MKSNDEIVVIDNNHEVYEDYKELLEYCKLKNIRFQHHDFIAGYKAGALNQALKITSSYISHIFVIDCDYKLLPDVLESVRRSARNNSRYGFIQYPQAYRDLAKTDVDNELNKYFDYNLYINRNFALGTGTLCCVKRTVLESIGGWPTKSITEDALFGLKIQEIGLTGLYVPEIIGQGLLPHSIKDFYNQRKRWIYGNAEVLVEMLRNHKMNKFHRYNFSQLSTWIHFTGMTIVVHILVLLASLFHLNALIVLYFIYSHYSIILLFKFYEFGETSMSLTERIRSLSINWLFLWSSSFYWLPVIFNKSKEFVRTPKMAINKLKFTRLPMTFLIIHFITLVLYSYNPIIFTLSLLFILLDILGIKTLIKNFK